LVDRPGAGLLDELDLLVASGLTPRQALRAATTTAAAAAGRPMLGRIEVGAPASFLILNADPCADIRNIRKLAFVVLRGWPIGADELEKLRGLDQSMIAPAATP
jgi:enamidase